METQPTKQNHDLSPEEMVARIARLENQVADLEVRLAAKIKQLEESTREEFNRTNIWIYDAICGPKSLDDLE